MLNAVRPSVLILTGPPGAGKTTVARLLTPRYERAVHLESDYFFEAITSGHVEPWKTESGEQHRVVMRIVADAAAGYEVLLSHTRYYARHLMSASSGRASEMAVA